MGLEFHVNDSEEEMITKEVLLEVQCKHHKKKEFPALVRKYGNLMSSDSISILKKTDQRASIKSLVMVGASSNNRESSIFGSTLINILLINVVSII